MVNLTTKNNHRNGQRADSIGCTISLRNGSVILPSYLAYARYLKATCSLQEAGSKGETGTVSQNEHNTFLGSR